MSLILDALKKSEAERQLGRAPGLMSPTIRVSRRRGPSPWWGVLGLAAAIAGAAAWWVVHDRGDGPVARVPAGSVSTPAAPVAAVTRSPDPPTTASIQAPAPVPAPALTEVAPAEPDANAAVLPRDPEFDSVERESVPVAVQPTPVPPPPVMPATVPPIPAPSTPPPTQILPPMPAPPAPTGVAAASPTAPPADGVSSASAQDTPLPTVDATPAAPAAPAEPPLEALPSVNELMPDVRNALPPLKLSMHVYTAAPAARFVLIDGKRYAQGDRISDALRVEEIRRDGAVLDANGKRFLVPRP